MKDLIIKATVSGTSGFYYREEHEWRGLAPVAAAWFSAQMAEMTAYVQKAGSNKNDGDLTVELQAVVDGVAAPALAVSGIDRKELSKFQHMFAKAGEQLIGFGEERARHK